MAKAAIINGKIKWRVKNRVRVALLTPNPPHNHATIYFPIYGIAENRLVITVAPQNLICPHGSRYPINAVAIDKIKMVTPMFHVSNIFIEPKYNPRAIWRYRQRKNIEAPLAWKFRMAQP